MAQQDRFRLKRVWIEEEKGDSNPTTVKTYLLGLLIAILAGFVFGIVSLLLIVTTEELPMVLYFFVSILVSMSPRLLLKKISLHLYHRNMYASFHYKFLHSHDNDKI